MSQLAVFHVVTPRLPYRGRVEVLGRTPYEYEETSTSGQSLYVVRPMTLTKVFARQPEDREGQEFRVELPPRYC
jgi:hypothetical protein